MALLHIHRNYIYFKIEQSEHASHKSRYSLYKDGNSIQCCKSLSKHLILGKAWGLLLIYYKVDHTHNEKDGDEVRLSKW